MSTEVEALGLQFRGAERCDIREAAVSSDRGVPTPDLERRVVAHDPVHEHLDRGIHVAVITQADASGTPRGRDGDQAGHVITGRQATLRRLVVRNGPPEVIDGGLGGEEPQEVRGVGARGQGIEPLPR